jgi:hypothetical protein
LEFLGISRPNRDFSKGYGRYAPAKNYRTPLPEIMQTDSAKRPVSRQTAHTLKLIFNSYSLYPPRKPLILLD